MYVFVIVDKLNHCTAFKPKCSPWDNKYTHADIQVGLGERLAVCSCRRGAEVSGVQNQDCEGPTRTLRGPAAQRPRLLEVQGMYKKKKTFQTHDPGSEEPQGTKPGAKGSFSVSS